MLPTANFTNSSESGGAHLQGLHAATDFASNLTSVGATKTMIMSIHSASGITPVSFFLSYKIA